MMRSKLAIFLSISLLVLGVTAIRPAFADDSSGQVGQSLNRLGESAENAAVQVYDVAKVALSDIAITAKVKTALHDDKTVKDCDIHVSTTAGVVTLSGRVASPELAAHAQQLAQQTVGVESVNNQLTAMMKASGSRLE